MQLYNSVQLLISFILALLFFSFHSINFAVNQDKNHWLEIARLYCSSHGVPEGQPQFKSSPMRKEVQDVAEAKEKCVCVCAYVYVCVREW